MAVSFRSNTCSRYPRRSGGKHHRHEGVRQTWAVYPAGMTAPYTPDPRLGENDVAEPDKDADENREDQPEVLTPSVEDPE